MTVAAEKTLKPQHIAVLGAADDDRSACSRLQDGDAAQDQRAHDALAKLGFRNHQRPQPLRRNDERLDRLLAQLRPPAPDGRPIAPVRP